MGTGFPLKKALLLKPFPSPWGEQGHFSSKGNGVFLKVPIEWALVNLADADVITLQGSDLRKKGLESMTVRDGGCGWASSSSWRLCTCCELGSDD